MAGSSHQQQDELSAKTLQKRYEGLVTVRTRAIKGKGAWYWIHLEPILFQNKETGLAKAVKLRCGLCSALFSASNPSRTASEHLKRGTCPNFNGPVPTPISSMLPRASSTVTGTSQNRKRSALSLPQAAVPTAMVASSHALPDSVNYSNSNSLVLSGGKEDLGALAMLEDSVKKLRSPGGRAAAGQPLSKIHVETALNFLAEWLYECCGSVSFSCVEHPKFKAFLNHLGLPPISTKYVASEKLDSKYDEVRHESDAKLKDALFFQLASDGWKKKNLGYGDTLVNLILNLPNGTSLFHKALFTNTAVSSKYVEETLWETITGICDSSVEKCVGIVADTGKHKTKALRDLERKNCWMVNLTCQAQAFNSLLKDFHKHHCLFKNVASECFKLATFFNSKHQASTYFQKYQMQEMDHIKPFRVPPDSPLSSSNFLYNYAMMEDIASSARALQLTMLDDSFKVIYAEDPVGREIADTMNNRIFWNELEAVLALVRLIRVTSQEVENERPLVGQCLPLWNEMRLKVKDWCSKYSLDEGPVKEIIEKRFMKNYHPAWAAAYILDPLYLIRDSSGKYLPPFKCLTTDQEKDVDKIITRLVYRDEAHIALMELMKWRAEGLDPLYAQAVQVKQPDPVTGKMKIANPQSSRLVWETCLSEFKVLSKVAIRLIFLHATSCGLKCNMSFMRWLYTHGHSRAAMDRAQKMIYIASHAKLERRDFLNEEEKDVELFADSEDDPVADIIADPPM